jgi:hypothetical protein
MANTLPVRVSVTVKDAWGIEASSCAYALADPTKTLTQLEADVTAFLTTLDATTDAIISRCQVSILPVLPTTLKTTLGTALVEQTGLLGFSAAGSTKRYSYAIPAISDGGTVLSGDRMVMTSGDPIPVLIAFLTTVQTVLAFANAHNQEISAFIDALVSFHKKRKQLQRSSYEV